MKPIKKKEQDPKVHIISNRLTLRFTPPPPPIPPILSSLAPLLVSSMIIKKTQISGPQNLMSKIKSFWSKVTYAQKPKEQQNLIYKLIQKTENVQTKSRQQQIKNKPNLNLGPLNVQQQTSKSRSKSKSKKVHSKDASFKYVKQIQPKRESIDQAKTAEEKTPQLSLQQNKNHSSRLTFAFRFAFEHILIGNQDQLDVIRVSRGIRDVIEAQYIWSFQYNNSKISHVCIEQKSKINILVITAGKQAYIYVYDVKRIPAEPLTPLKCLHFEQPPKFVQIAKQSNLCFFFQKHLEVFIGGNTWRRRYNSKYVLPQIQTCKLFYVPTSFQNYLSVFFQQKSRDQKSVFSLWEIQYEFGVSEIKAKPIQKIYQIKQSLRNSIKLTNYSKEIFLLNLGSQILALKKGYMLDNAQVNLRIQQSKMEYAENNVLLLISSRTIEVYNFTINLNIKPFKIVVKSLDSIQVPSISKDDQFFKAIPIFEEDYAIIYQKKNKKNKLKNGELHYQLFLTRSLSKQQKMIQLFPKAVKTFNIKDEEFLEKKDIAQKMGYTTKQIYLQLWNRSSQQSVEDWNLLANTSDYSTILAETLKKLRKTSINYSQIQAIQRSCLNMLKSKIFSFECTQQNIMEYISCHFFIKKLRKYLAVQLYERKLSINKKNDPNKVQLIKLTIRQYQQQRNVSIKQKFMKYIESFICQDKTEVVYRIRFLMQEFKFIFRIIYEQLLQEIIKIAKQNIAKLIDLLKAIPQILPYKIPIDEETNNQMISFKSGIWQQITKEQWKQNLYIDSILTIDNKQIVQQVIKSVNFKRNWLFSHGMVDQTQQNIKKIDEKIKSNHVFYFFIAKLFEVFQQFGLDEGHLKSIINFLEVQYSDNQCDKRQTRSIRSSRSHYTDVRNINEVKARSMPQKIKGKVFLYERIYSFFKSKQILPQKHGQPLSLTQFFQLSDPQLIKLCFEKQRSIKGLLLGDIKGIYQQFLSSNQQEIFNEALISYFKSQYSQVSDLKYLLNRINNEKQKFHRKNPNLYPVLIEALQHKMKIGTQKDIPLDEVLIYLENIPNYTISSQYDIQNEGFISKNVAFTKQLQAIHNINLVSKKLKKAKLNMSLYDILRKSKQVFTKLIQYQINQAAEQTWQSINEFKQFSVKVIIELQVFSRDVYGNFDYNHHLTDDKTDIFFIYLGKVCQKQSRVKMAKALLQMEQFRDRYQNFNIQGLVQSMFIWKMASNRSYIQNESYIWELLSLIPQQAATYQCIYNELQYVKFLNPYSSYILYPVCQNIIKYQDLQDHLNMLPIKVLMGIDIQNLFKIIKNIQTVKINAVQLQESSQNIPEATQLTKQYVYEIFIMRYMKQKQVNLALPLIKKYLNLQKDEKMRQFDIVFPILYILAIIGQLNEHNKEGLVQCVWYYFNQPKQLLNIVEYIVVTQLTQKAIRQYIDDQLAKGKVKYKRYNQKNPILNKLYLEHIESNQKLMSKFDEIIYETTKKLRAFKQQFKNLKYSVIMAILCHNPYVLAKFIFCSNETNLKPIKSLISFACLQDIFQPFILLQMGRRIFLALLQNLLEQFHLQNTIKDFEQFGIDEQNQISIEGYQPVQQNEQNYLQLVYESSIQGFRSKKQQLRKDLSKECKYLKNYNKSLEQKKQNIINIFQDKVRQQQQQRSHDASYYIFEDEDNQQDKDLKIDELKKFRLLKKKSYLSKKIQLLKNSISKVGQHKQSKRCTDLRASSDNINMIRKSNRLCVSTRFNNYLSPSTINLQKNSSNISQQHPMTNLANTKSLSPGHLKQHEIQHNENPAKITYSIPIVHYQYNNSNQNFQRKFDDDNSLSNCPSYSKSEQIPSQNCIGYQNQINQVVDQYNPSNIHVYMEEQIKEQNLQKQDDDDDQFQDVRRSKTKSVEAQLLNSSNQSIQYQQLQKEQQVLQQGQQLEQETSKINVEQMSRKILDSNKNVNQIQAQYDTKMIEPFKNDQAKLLQLIKQLYRDNIKQPSIRLALNLISQIVDEYKIEQLNSDTFKYFIKLQEAQRKTIPQLSLSEIIPQQTVFKQYRQAYQLFCQIYKRIYKHVDSESLYKILLFIRKVFDNKNYEEEIIWDFVLDLCEKIDKISGIQRQWNLQKIQVTLPKISIQIWNSQFQKFEAKVLRSSLKDQILDIFCVILQKSQKKNAILFLQKVAAFHKSDRVMQTLQHLKCQPQ